MRPRLPKLFDLTGQTAVVSGGGSGLGRHMAEALAELGASIVLCARNRERCDEEAAAIRSDFGVAAIGLHCDVRDRATIDDVVTTSLDRFGTIDVLVNNAGTTWGGPALEMPIVAWQKVIDVNLTGLFALTQAAAGAMASQGRGSIINITSIAALQGMRPEALDAIAYTASKGAVVSLTRDLAVKWARHGVRINAIAPGWFPSDMSQHSLDANGPELLERIPLGRFGEPEEIKGAVAYLASAASSFVTGTVLVVDGGQTAG